MDLKIKDVAELLNVSETTIRRWLAEGKIPAYRIHHQYRFSRMEIENWVMSCRLKKEENSFASSEEKQIYPPQNHLDDHVCETGNAQQQFSLFRAIHRGDVLETDQIESKEALIRETVHTIASQLNLDEGVLTELLLDRENLMPTALNNGVAVPHTREFLIKRPFDVIVAVYPKTPINWGALDGVAVHTLFFLFACDDKRHLHLLAKIAHFSSDQANLDFLKTKPSKDKLLHHIKSWESQLKKTD